MQLDLISLKKNKLGFLIDDSTTDGRGIIFAPAEGITADVVNLMITISSGILYVAVSSERASAFALNSMSRPRTLIGNSLNPMLQTCVSVEAREGVTTGISAADRATTIRVLGEKNPSSRKLVKPGHIFPVITKTGGVLMQHALPEGALDLVRLIDSSDAAAFLDLLDEHGNFQNSTSIKTIAENKGIPIFYLSELTQYRLQTERLIERVAEARLPTQEAGELKSIIFRSKIHDGEHVALIKGEISPNQAILTRVQAENTFTDVFGGNSTSTRHQLHKALQAIGNRGNGVLVYMRRSNTGVLKQQVLGSNTQSSLAAVREYGLGSQILRDLGIQKIDLLTNSSHDYSGVRAFGLEIVKETPLF
jgi:3,4-dihydroxy 2-butanone 4-phosphate synthase / GTP cyclohydrolase II